MRNHQKRTISYKENEDDKNWETGTKMDMMSEKRAHKMTILKKIKINKNILFCKPKNQTTKLALIKSWQRIHELSAQLGLIPQDKDWKYTRYAFWPNVKRTTLVRIFLFFYINSLKLKNNLFFITE